MTEPQESHFLALVSRMRYIERWALMRSSRPENLSEHALEVAAIAHMLCVIGNVRFGRALSAERAALVSIYHDASEIITGDMPTPVKYHDGQIRDAYKAVEKNAEERLLATLPEDLRPTFEDVFWPVEDAGEEERYLRRLVKAADKISALIKCVDEARSGNAEFSSAERTCRAAVEEMAAELPEVADFVRDFLPSYGATLDELL
ncbi:5'-deoxynucleotidase [Olsenella sp. An293]|uniref:5'-deoxynucleotidase n=1 Tax=Olsenella sp. An293 TaxID=1965626 RepID=UPI000B3A51BD|nr:5'-deoxynucleotidase [Olsenella sp. An293]OUO32066.1 5'-deoxynucleotidase [Olsenella sp. An293]